MNPDLSRPGAPMTDADMDRHDQLAAAGRRAGSATWNACRRCRTVHGMPCPEEEEDGQGELGF